MGREVEWNLENICDDCGEFGAYDFYGDFICQECIEKAEKKAVSLDELKEFLLTKLRCGKE